MTDPKTFPPQTKVTIVKPGHKYNDYPAIVKDVINKGGVVHVVNRPSSGYCGFLGEFKYNELKKGW